MDSEPKLIRRGPVAIAVVLVTLGIAAAAMAAAPVRGGHYRGSSKPLNIGGNSVKFDVSKKGTELRHFTVQTPFFSCQVGSSNGGTIVIGTMKIKNGGFSGSGKTRTGVLRVKVHGRFDAGGKAHGSEKATFKIKGLHGCSLTFAWTAGAH